MNLYKYLIETEERQKIFCEDLARDIPEIIEYMKEPRYNGEKYVYISQCRFTLKPSLSVNITKSIQDSSCFNMFNIFDCNVKDYYGWGILNRHNMSYQQEKDLEPIVRDWCLRYETNIIRKSKLERIV